MVGYWLDTDTNDIHVIEWQTGQFVVTAVNDDQYGVYPVTSQLWDGSQLTWTYYVTDTGVSVTFTTISASGNNLYTTWSNDQGDSGDWTLIRTDSPYPQPAPVSSDQEAIPGLAGQWLDPDTSGTVTTIVWENGEYVITSIMNPDRGNNELTWYTWQDGTLSWEYCPENMYCITSQLVDVSGDSMTADWWWTDGGNSGTTTYQRVY